MLHSQYINGSLAYWQSHRKRIIDAIGAEVVKFVEDFTCVPTDDATGDPTGFTVTIVEAGTGDTTVVAGDTGNGTLLITTAGNEDDGANIQAKGSPFKIEAGKPLYFGARIQGISDVDETDLFVGLAVTDTDILGGVADRIGFESLDGTAALSFVIEKDGTQTTVAALGNLADATPAYLEFYWDGEALEVFLDGASVAVPALTNLPDDVNMRVSCQFQNGEAASNTLHLDKLACIKFGRQ